MQRSWWCRVPSAPVANLKHPALCIKMEFYLDISLESRCNSEVEFWAHFYQCLVAFQVNCQLVNGMSGKNSNFQNLIKYALNLASLKGLHIDVLICGVSKGITTLPNLIKINSDLNPNWHEAGHFYPPCNFGIEFCQLNLYQIFPNFFGGENLHHLGWFDALPSSLSLIKIDPLWR